MRSHNTCLPPPTPHPTPPPWSASHFILELFLMNNLIGLSVNDGDDVLLVANGDGLSIGAPAEVDVLPLGLHRVRALPS